MGYLVASDKFGMPQSKSPAGFRIVMGSPGIEGFEEVPAPMVTVVLPVYNAGKHLRLAVQSIVCQSFPNWELLVIDDGSTDDAISTISDITDERIRIISDGQNRGLVARLNQAIDLASGIYLARMDGDDISSSSRLMRQVDELQRNPNLDVVAVRAFEIDENSQIVGLFPFAESHKEICGRPWLGFHMLHPTWMGRTTWFRKHMYSVPAPFLCEDQELLLRSYPTSQFLTINAFLFGYRVKSGPSWEKLSKTRFSVWSFQCRFFIKNKQWYYLIMATIAYHVRQLSDFSKRYGLVVYYRRTDVIPNALVSEWKSTIENLSSSAKSRTVNCIRRDM